MVRQRPGRRTTRTPAPMPPPIKPATPMEVPEARFTPRMATLRTPSIKRRRKGPRDRYRLRLVARLLPRRAIYGNSAAVGQTASGDKYAPQTAMSTEHRERLVADPGEQFCRLSRLRKRSHRAPGPQPIAEVVGNPSRRVPGFGQPQQLPAPPGQVSVEVSRSVLPVRVILWRTDEDLCRSDRCGYYYWFSSLGLQPAASPPTFGQSVCFSRRSDQRIASGGIVGRPNRRTSNSRSGCQRSCRLRRRRGGQERRPGIHGEV